MKVSRNQNTLVLTNQEVFALYDAVTLAWEGWYAEDSRAEAENPYEGMQKLLEELKNGIVHGVNVEMEG